MLIKLSVTQWSARKYDRTVTQRAVKEFNAQSDAGRFNKLLMQSPELQDIAKISGATRKDHYDLTLPWFDDGSRILPSKMYMDYTAKMRDNKEKFELAVQRFLKIYPELIERAKSLLGDMFSDEDYPDVKIIASKFAFTTFVMPIPSKHDFRVFEMNGEQEQIKRDIEQRVNAQVIEAKKDLWLRLYDAINTVKERLSDPEAIFRDSLIFNVRDLAKIIVKLNIDEDRNITDTLAVIDAKVSCISPDTLRQVPAVRSQLVSDSKTILKTIERFK